MPKQRLTLEREKKIESTEKRRNFMSKAMVARRRTIL